MSYMGVAPGLIPPLLSGPPCNLEGVVPEHCWVIAYKHKGELPVRKGDRMWGVSTPANPSSLFPFLQLLRKCILQMTRPVVEGSLGSPPFEKPNIEQVG